MAIKSRVLYVSLNLLFLTLCHGHPIDTENISSDAHSELLTGLVAVLLTICGVLFLAGCLGCFKKDGFKQFRESPIGASVASNLDHGHVNPIANGEFTIFTPLSPPHYNNNVFLAHQQEISHIRDDFKNDDIDVSCWFDGEEKDFPRSSLKYIRELGRGWFGRVVEGAAQGVNNDDGNHDKWTPVVVRILEASASSRERAVFLNDASIYRCTSHSNILCLVGRSLETIPLLLIQEYHPKGDLKKYLRSQKENIDSFLRSDYPILWCCQLASALRHLHESNLPHPDFAARNCLVTKEFNVKIGDYGLSISNYPEDYYLQMPDVSVRWCAPESVSYTHQTIQPKPVSKSGNIWSFGVTMWEICEAGAQPYESLTDDEVISKVFDYPHVRLQRPTHSLFYTDYLYRLMQNCWSSLESRPSINQIDIMLTDLMQVYKNTSFGNTIQNFDERWEKSKPNIVSNSDIRIIDGEMLDRQSNIGLSGSLDNIRGSMNNLLTDSSKSRSDNQLDSWLNSIEVNPNDQPLFSELPDTVNNYALEVAVDNASHNANTPSNASSQTQMLQFRLGPINKTAPFTLLNENDSLTDSMLYPQRVSSESETEDENWKKKIEQGAYTEKVRQKSRSVADLMVLTHIDCSESDPETPLPSLDYRINYKNVRYAPKNNLENVSLMFGSEGNLLRSNDTFERELKKLKEERRDSLLFVPENEKSDEDVNIASNSSVELSKCENPKDTSPQKKILEELNSPIDIKPANQVYNVFHMTVDSKFSPIRNAFSDVINLKSDLKESENLNFIEVISESCPVVKCESSKSDKFNRFEMLEDVKIEKDIDGKINDFNTELEKPISETLIICKANDTYQRNLAQSNCDTNIITGNVDNLENTLKDNLPKETKVFNVPKLTEIIENNVELLDYIIKVYDNGEDIDFDDVGNDNSYDLKNDLNETSAVCSDLVKQTEENGINNITRPTVSEFVDNKMNNSENIENDNHSVRNTAKNLMGSNLTEIRASKSDNLVENLWEDMEANSNVTAVTSTPFIKEQVDIIPKLDSYHQQILDFDLESDEGENLKFSSNFSDTFDAADIGKNDNIKCNENLSYSLETWEHFLGNALEKQGSEEKEMFENYDDNEPLSLLFVENNEILDNNIVECINPVIQSRTEHLDVINETPSKLFNNSRKLNSTFTMTAVLNETYIPENDCIDTNEGTFIKTTILDQSDECIKNPTDEIDADNDNQLPTNGVAENKDIEGKWESNGGWFLHPQSTSKELTGEITTSQQSTSDSYVGFSMDDEIMAAIRNELLSKLPNAQRTTNDHTQETEDNDGEKNEIFIQYNMYNTPLSPIPEESYCEEDDSYKDYMQNDNDGTDDEDSNWSEPGIVEPIFLNEEQGTESQSANITCGNKGFLNRHTPSQESCCSNDTLFNLEELGVTNNDDKIDEMDLNNEEGYDSLDKTYTTESTTTNLDQTVIVNKECLEDLQNGDDNTEKVYLQPTVCTVNYKDLKTVECNELENCKNEMDSSVATLAYSEDLHDCSEKENNIHIINHLNFNNNISSGANDAFILTDKLLNPLQQVLSNPLKLTDICKNAQKIYGNKIDIINDKNLPNSPKIMELEEKAQVVSTKDFDIESSDNPNSNTHDQFKIRLDTSSMLKTFLQNERESYKIGAVCKKDEDNSTSESYQTVSDSSVNFLNVNVAPLNSPEDRQWKQLAAPFLSANKQYGSENKSNENSAEKEVYFLIEQKSATGTTEAVICSPHKNEIINTNEIVNKEIDTSLDSTSAQVSMQADLNDYVNINDLLKIKQESDISKLNKQFTEGDQDKNNVVCNEASYENLKEMSEVDYLNLKNVENSSPDYINTKYACAKYENTFGTDEEIEPVYVNNLESEEGIEEESHLDRLEDLYGPLTDIRFTGPGDQLMSTSFSTINDDDHDWDSGSDTRSSSSGEFIWKEGEHEESVKALRAAPQDVQTEEAKQMEDILEEEITDSSGSEEEGESPEFVPSAWDKYATPTKSALRSPEKTLEKDDKERKSRAVWFKKQKYHCVYEYPREPESPILQSYDLWQPTPDFSTLADWEIDPDSYMPTACKDDNEEFRLRRNRNLYQFSSSSLMDGDFYMSTCANPFDMKSDGQTSQFFPGKFDNYEESNKLNENVTPDSGIDDLTPGSIIDDSTSDQPVAPNQVQYLKTLAAIAANKNVNYNKTTEVLGGLRHTRNRLKLDLPPSPNAFSTYRGVSFEPISDPVIPREVPTFTTFGKGRFLVQHVDTPPDEQGDNVKNVSFEAIPYKASNKIVYNAPDEKDKHKIEIVRGEASLLDSADEDSGIESCTLERKTVSKVE